MNDEFYIGWQDRAPQRLGGHLKALVAVLSCLAVLLAIAAGAAQRTIGKSIFEWSTVKDFNGILIKDPYPHLLVNRPGQIGTTNSYSIYLLVNPFKFGLDAEASQRHQGRKVTLKGTLIYRDGQTMIEVVPGSIRPLTENKVHIALERVSLGRQTLRGEIVDSKCYFGVMNPGEFIPHRACAIRCISGGIPPVLVVRRENASPLHFILVSAAGATINQQILPFVAEPLEITGEVVREGEMLILRADPKSFRRL